MRIVVHGQQAFGKAVLEALLERGEDVVAVYAPPEGGRPDPLAEAAEAAGLPLVRPASFKDPAVLEEFRALAPDLQVMAFVTLIVPAEFLSVPDARHDPVPPVAAASAPRSQRDQLAGHQGRDGDRPHRLLAGRRHRHRRRAAAEAHAHQRDRHARARSYFDRLFPMGVEALVEAVDLVRAGTAPRLPQDESLATYEAPCERENARIDWGKPCRQLHDLVRGCDPAPGAWTTCGGEVLQIFAAEPLPARDAAGVGGAMGEVVEVGDGGFSVVCADGRLRVTRVKPAGGKKTGAGEWAAASGLVPGARLE